MNKCGLVIFIGLLLSGCSGGSDAESTPKNMKTETVAPRVVIPPVIASKDTQKEAVSYQFVELSADALEESLSVESGRIYAVFEFNSPSVVINLPKNENSEFAEINFKDTEIRDLNGADIKHEIIRGLYKKQYFSKAIRFSNPQDREVPLVFASVKGNIVVNYPLSMSIEKFTETVNEKRGVNVSINQNTVLVTGNLDAVAGKAGIFLSRSPISVFNAKGELLTPMSGKPTWAMNGQVELSFDQEPKEVHIALTEKMHKVVMPYELEPSALLPENTKGVRPQ